MFNLLRSTRHKKKSSKNTQTPAISASEQRQQQRTTTPAATASTAPPATTARSYRAARARATAVADAASSKERYRRFSEHERERAPVAAPPVAASRATIDELDDDLREFDFVDVDGAAAGSFCDRRAACAQQKVNLASNTPQRAARSARSAAETTNSAITEPAKEFAYSKDAADGINKIVAATALSAAGAGANSQYEPAEWQGHNIENDRNGTGDEHREHVPTTGKRCQIIDTFRERSHADNASDRSAIRSTATPLCRSSIDVAQQSASCSQTVRGNAPISAKSQQQVAPPAEEAAAVKYRKHSVDTSGGKEAQNFERKRQSRLSLTLGLGGGKNKSAANDTADNSDKELKRSHVGQSLRRSFFRHKTKSIERDSEPDRSHDQAQTRQQEQKEEEQLKRPNSTLFFKAAATADKTTTTLRDRGPLQRSKEFLSDIFMARGRNNNRNKSQGNLQQQQQSQQSQHSQSKQQSAQSSSFHDRQTAGNPPPNPNTIPTTEIRMLGANINHFANNNGKNNEQHVTAWTQHSAHLETSCDPAASMSTNTPIATTTTTTIPATANTYQMTTSNNSPKNFSRSNREREERAQQRRSNSAEHVRDVFGARVRARSEDPRAGEQAGVSTWRTPPEVEDCQRLNGAVGVEQRFNRASNRERNGTCNAADTADRPSDNVVDVVAGAEAAHDRAQDQQRPNSIKNERRNARESRSPTPLFNVNGTDTSHAEDGGQLNDLTECDRDNLLQQHNERDVSEHAAMGQTNAKADTPRSSRASTPRDFRESIIPVENITKAVLLPTITVMDYGDVKSDSDALGSKGAAKGSDPVEQEVFYDFENESGVRPKSVDSTVNITAVDEDGEEIEDEVFQEQATGATYRNKWSPPAVIAVTKAGTPSTMLEDVPEQEEEDEEDADDYEEDDEEEDDDDDEAAGLEEQQHKRQRYDDMANSAGAVAGNSEARNLDNELYRQHFEDSPERSPLKSTNTSDSNLSTSFPDSGLGDSISSSPSGKHLHGTVATAAASTGDNEMATSAITANGASRQQQQQQKQRSPFVRDGNSTDCDDTLLQYDDLDYAEAASDLNERLVCIESISLPDVVVESTTGSSGSSSTTSLTASSTGDAIVNINGATGNSMGNVHFIPIHIESNQSHGNGNGNQKRRSVDDSAIGCNGKKSFAHMNGLQSKPIIEIVEEDASETDFGSKLNGMRTDNTAEKLKRELIEQKSRLNVQLEDAQKNVHNLQSEVGEMQTKIHKLEEELSSKTWNVERLQNELIAAQKDDDCVRKRLKVLEAEKLNLRHQYDEYEDEFKRKYEELEAQYQKLEEKYEATQNLARSLQTQLAAAQMEAEEWRKQVEKIRGELEEQLQLLKNALDNSEAERKINEDKWQKEFEMLRTQNMDREESLMTDCEWQLRQMQKQFKDKHDKSQTERHATREKVDMLETALVQRQQEVDHLKVFQAEVSSLRGVVTDQEVSIQLLMQQIETLKVDLETANRNLEQQIQAVKQIKHKCDNAISDKERQTIYRIDEVRNEAAAFWENKLYTEMTRLKNELESVYVDERREALNKLQTEHIEELRALTTRYTANEEELRVELAELQEKFERRNEEFLELRERSDNSLLQTRMHLDRADREYQNAMCREEDRREALEESLRKEFEKERTLMEERFRERLGQVKDEFAKELQNSTQEHAEEHQKEIAKQKAKLQAQKDDAIQELTERYKNKLAAAEDQIKDIELRHQHDLKDLKAAYDTEKTSLDKRDMSNANEIEQLHRKCRCLTNLFEEMRMRYERRDPRPEDLREIAELRSRCESQERDLFLLTDRLRELQNQMSEEHQNGDQLKNNAKQVKKPPPKTIPTNCDVIYEENEERESPPPQPLAAKSDDEGEEEDEDEDEDEDENEDDVAPAELNDSERKSPALKQIILNGKELNQNLDLINEDDSQMITAV